MPDKNIQENNLQKNKIDKEHQQTEKAFEQAEEDIEKDPEMRNDENEDLDEGELARKEGHP